MCYWFVNIYILQHFSIEAKMISLQKDIFSFEKLSINTLLISVFQQIITNNYKKRFVNAYNSNVCKSVLWQNCVEKQLVQTCFNLNFFTISLHIGLVFFDRTQLQEQSFL